MQPSNLIPSMACMGIFLVAGGYFMLRMALSRPKQLPEDPPSTGESQESKESPPR